MCAALRGPVDRSDGRMAKPLGTLRCRGNIYERFLTERAHDSHGLAKPQGYDRSVPGKPRSLSGKPQAGPTLQAWSSPIEEGA